MGVGPYLTSSLTPIRYAIHRQKDIPREALLVRDQKTGIAYPKSEAMRTENRWRNLNVAHHRAIMLLYTIIVLGGSAWLV